MIDPKNTWNIEIRVAGAWEAVDTTDNLEDALLLASSYCENTREKWIRIIGPDNKIL